MGKKNKQNTKSRDAPSKRDAGSGMAWLCSPTAYDVLCGQGYMKLSQCPEVMMCVQKYADLISSMTIHLMQNTSNGNKRVHNELSRKVDIEPYHLMTRKTWMYNIVRALMLEGDGNQVTLPHFTRDGYLEDLEPIPPMKVSFMPKERTYMVYIDGVAYTPDEVLHFVIRPDPNQPWLGTGYRAVLKDVIKGLKQAETTKQKLMESPLPSVIAKVDGLSSDMDNPAGRKKLSDAYLSGRETGEPWIIPAEAFEIQQLKPLTLNDLAIKQGVELDKRTVAGIFSTPPFVVGVGSYNKDEYNNFIESGIMPFALEIQQELTRGLLYAPDWFFQLNKRSLYAYSMEELINAGKEMSDRAALGRNEWRDWVGMEPRDDMEELITLENYIPTKMLGQQNKLNGGEEDAG